MTLTVVIHRQTKEQPDYGYLRAYVIQDGHRGANLLAGRHLTGVDAAKDAVRRQLQRMLPGAQIVFEGPADVVRAVEGAQP